MYKITVALFTYNQEKFIKEAIESVINQDCDFDYEIIISDDCSKDNTFNIIKNYPYPERILPHLRLIRNETNLGIISHVNNIFREAQGEWIVMCAGDDISLPNRLRVLEPHMQDGVMGVCSNYFRIDQFGRRLDSFSKLPKSIYDLTDIERVLTSSSNIFFSGCAASWKRSLILSFDELNTSTCYSEDVLFSFRALITGTVYFCDEELLEYRIHEQSISHNLVKDRTAKLEMFAKKDALQRLVLMEQMKKDIATIKLSDTRVEQALLVLEKELEGIITFWDLPVSKKWILLKGKSRFSYLRLLPFPIYCTAMDIMRFSKKKIKHMFA